MALPFLNNQIRRPDRVVAIDLGSRFSKAVHVHWRPERLALLGYAVQDAPNRDKSLTVEALAEHLNSLWRTVGERTRHTSLALGVNDAFLRPAELPMMAVQEMRQMLKFNSKAYLQQDLPDHVFDCVPLASELKPDPSKAANGSARQRVLVTAAKKKVVDEVQAACKQAGLSAQQIVPNLIGVPNAFEKAEPAIWAKEVIALVDIGFKNTTIALLRHGELQMSRTLALGGDRITAGLAEVLGISYAEAEGIKVGMPQEVQQNLEAIVAPLGRELRASVDFFEHQHDAIVSQVFVSGGTARSQSILRLLQNEVVVPCQPWNPVKSLELALAPAQAAQLEQIAPQLTVALGAAAAAF